MFSSKNVKVSQKRCLGTSIESFTGSSRSEQIISANMPNINFCTIITTANAGYIELPIFINPIWTGGGGQNVSPLRVFAIYLKNGLTDPCQTL